MRFRESVTKYQSGSVNVRASLSFLKAVAAQGKLASPIPPCPSTSLETPFAHAILGPGIAIVTCRYHQNKQGFLFSVDWLARTMTSNPGFRDLFPLVPIDEPQAAAFLAEFADGYNEEGRLHRLSFVRHCIRGFGFYNTTSDTQKGTTKGVKPRNRVGYHKRGL